MKEALVVGVVGKIGAGKDTVCKLLASRLGASELNISDIVRNEAREAGVDLGRSSLTDFSARMLRSHGPHYFLDQIAVRVRQSSRASVVISGVRTTDNIRRLRELFEERSIVVVAVVCDTALRYCRIRQRASEGGAMTDNQLKENDSLQEGHYGIEEAICLADITLDNSGSMADLRRLVDELVVSLRGGGAA